MISIQKSLSNLSRIGLMLIDAYTGCRTAKQLRAATNAMQTNRPMFFLPPDVRERMRKRRAFADKELESTMLERECQWSFYYTAHARWTNPTIHRVQQSSSASLALERLTVEPKAHLPPRTAVQRLFPVLIPSAVRTLESGHRKDVTPLEGESIASYSARANEKPVAPFSTVSNSMLKNFHRKPAQLSGKTCHSDVSVHHSVLPVLFQDKQTNENREISTSKETHQQSFEKRFDLSKVNKIKNITNGAAKPPSLLSFSVERIIGLVS
ncbi:uncharacterized protein LOC117122743 isoform X2 [Anneissia japonica]|uniref:uncharacterized protein LOC117122743 isoform X2 n=1 Tax=Anneissia japonica TaxID=1529436 RepID=UPI0014255160|nr:uncharacterized protein LOC117122743 isoform X2 [Anneissia japonica]